MTIERTGLARPPASASEREPTLGHALASTANATGGASRPRPVSDWTLQPRGRAKFVIRFPADHFVMPETKTVIRRAGLIRAPLRSS
ncbi:hypothetical protein [Jiella sonneratiae]|uniref:Uncharacterized protein n=1 Tax=Jiella sonneratiae TaxID=2816856 RepID=A0ABS3J086_9HYPH|nr:hypothetical protein [Jiella sonneratiae]MBO0902378.1 hypothetical protein [Jiella sonneratiae]